MFLTLPSIKAKEIDYKNPLTITNILTLTAMYNGILYFH